MPRALFSRYFFVFVTAAGLHDLVHQPQTAAAVFGVPHPAGTLFDDLFFARRVIDGKPALPFILGDAPDKFHPAFKQGDQRSVGPVYLYSYFFQLVMVHAALPPLSLPLFHQR
ncbi:hypothetical protein SDC9_162280 [bioreactor metagenome]|uniref:Uncharacterized protein n=1 Tax=bioreactor metagenome TaxID=1076179 RepID=A0A645FKN8_9ZZZZ